MRQVEKLFNSMLTTVRENKMYTKKIIVRLYKEGYQTPEIARKTNHTLEACDRYIKAYKRVEKLNTKMSIDEIAGTPVADCSVARSLRSKLRIYSKETIYDQNQREIYLLVKWEFSKSFHYFPNGIM
jgi:hypothetical protein